MGKSKVAVLYGGMSAEREVSLRSGQAAYDALVRLGYETALIDMDKDVAFRIKESGAEVCFIALHGTYGEDGRIQGMLDIMDMAYTGSNFESNMIAFDKLLSKEQFVKCGVPTPAYSLLTDKMPFKKCVVKPCRQGSSVGIHIVDNENDYKEALKDAEKYDSKIMLEECVDGKEFTVSILGSEVLPIIWIRPKKGVYDYESKYTKGMTEYVFETEVTDEQYKYVQDTAKRAFDALGCSGYGRVDIIFDGKEAYVLEVNTLPGMTETSLLPKAAGKAGMTFDMMVERMLHGAEKHK
ncbi:MAG: D-alanine--D-alanine ligase [Deferribacterales bacterium]